MTEVFPPLLETNMISGGIDNLVASIHHIMKSYRYIIYDGQIIIHILLYLIYNDGPALRI